MAKDALLWICGAAGAMMYAFPLYMTCRKTDAGLSCFLQFIFAIIAGAIFGGLVTPFIGHKFPWTVDPVPYPLALGVGLLANPLLPKIIERGTSIFNSLGLGATKP